jgi:hypothetical protein
MPPQTFEVTAPDGRVLEITGDRVPTEAELTQIFKTAGSAKPAQPVTSQPSQQGGGFMDTAIEFGKGVLKSPLSVIETGGNLIRKIPGVQQFEDATGLVYDTGINTQPTNTAQTVGRVVGDIGTAFVPGGAVTRGAKAAAALAPRGAGIITRGLVEGAGSATIGAAQGYDPTVSGLVGGTVGMAGQGIRAARGALRNPNAVEREALEYAAAHGVPVDAGTMSGNAALKGAKYLADKTLAGSTVATGAVQNEAKGLATLGEHLAAKAHPSAVTPTTAGEGVTKAVTKVVTDLHGEADQAYGALRALEPKNTVKVQVGTKASPSGLVKDATPVYEDMAFPVNLKSAKAALRPIYERMKRQMPVTQQDASPGLKALENIMSGPDVAPASIVDLDLSAIKAIARSASMPEMRDVGQGIAAAAVKQLDQAVMSAVAKGGATATKALVDGRKATVSKYLANEVLEGLRSEPVKAFRQATEPKDAAIAQLRELARLAPNEMPKVGRAVLEDMLGSATTEGGFKGAASLATKWQNLGPQTKALLYGKTPGLTTELDKFFLAAKRLAENPNPSGSGGIVSLGTQGGIFLIDPVLGTSAQITGYTLAKALRNPRVVRLLTQGMKANPNSVTGRAVGLALQRAIGPQEQQPRQSNELWASLPAQEGQ